MEERRGERYNGPFLNAITFRVITPARSKVHFTRVPVTGQDIYPWQVKDSRAWLRGKFYMTPEEPNETFFYTFSPRWNSRTFPSPP